MVRGRRGRRKKKERRKRGRKEEEEGVNTQDNNKEAGMGVSHLPCVVYISARVTNTLCCVAYFIYQSYQLYYYIFLCQRHYTFSRLNLNYSHDRRGYVQFPVLLDKQLQLLDIPRPFLIGRINTSLRLSSPRHTYSRQENARALKYTTPDTSNLLYQTSTKRLPIPSDLYYVIYSSGHIQSCDLNTRDHSDLWAEVNAASGRTNYHT